MAQTLTFRQGGWRYLIPNALTGTNIALGALSCLMSAQGEPYLGGWLILLAVLFDRFDGATARALKATGKFGIEFDSLADLVSFGIAPAVFIFAAMSQETPYAEAGWPRVMLIIVCVLYVLAIAFRLARFNVSAGSAGSRIYFGLPSPAGAACVIAPHQLLAKYSGRPELWPSWDGDVRWYGDVTFGEPLRHLFPIWVVFIAVLLVSGLRVPKFQKPNHRFWGIYFVVNLAIIYLTVLLRLFPEYLILVMFQVLLVAFIFHCFWESARQARSLPFFAVLSAPAEPEALVPAPDPAAAAAAPAGPTGDGAPPP